MGGLIQRITDFSFTDTTLPIIYDDPRIVPGTIAMVDLTNIEGRDVLPQATVPANNAAIPDVAWRHAAQVMGVSNPVRTDFNHRFSTNAGGNILKFERTAKGGLHGVMSQTNDDGSKFAFIGLSAKARQYVRDNLTHTYLGIMWSRTTRAATSAQNIFEMEMDNDFAAASSYLFRFNSGLGAAGQPVRGVGSAAGWTGNFDYDGFTGLFAAWGNAGAYGGLGGTKNKRSYVLDLAMLVDVTYAQTVDPSLTVAAILAQNEALRLAAYAPGGKYAGDTIPTANPATSFP